jgi:iron complex transport system substrate-binding protein
VNRTRAAKAATVLLSLTLVAAACGGDDDAADSPADTPANTPSDTTADPAPTATTAAATVGSAAPVGTSVTTAADTTGAPVSDAFPVTIDHKYGATTIDAEPQRVVSVGFAEHDGLLALGVEPVAVRDWYGEQPYATWPWAQDELGDLGPEVIPAEAINFEQIAALEPDLIIGINSGMTDTEYATLAAIAPTVAQPAEFVDYGTPWRDALAITGRATGRHTEAAAVTAAVEELYAGVREAHPEFAGATASVAFQFQGQPGAYATGDARAQMLAELGFVTPPEFDELAGDQFYFSLSAEQIATLDTDVIVWLGSDEATIADIRDTALRPTLRAFAEGREVVADPMLAGAFSHGSPLSIPFVLDELVPELALAVDGDAATPVPSAAQIQPGYEPTAGAGDAATAGEAWARVFDSNVPYADKAAHIEDAAGLQTTIESYTTAGEAMGGITLTPTDVVVNGDTASITYDVLFGTTVAYSALDGTISRVDGTWVVGRDEFCSFMASARNACPA